MTLPRSVRAAVLATSILFLPPAAAQLAPSPRIDNLPRLGESGSDELSPQAERRLAESIMRQARRDPTYLDDAELLDWLNRFGSRLSSTPATAGFRFELFAIRDPSINAFALPGGWIGVHSGLLAASQTESEFASVVGHEMGHVVQRHINRMLAQQRQASTMAMAAMVAALLAARSSPDAAFGGLLLGDSVARQNLLSFSRDAEREADRIGLEIMRQAGFDLQGAVTFFGRLQQANRLLEAGAPAYMRTHPLTGERINDLQMRVREETYRQRPDSIEFGLMRARMRAIGDPSVDGLRRARQRFEAMLSGPQRETVEAWFGLANVAAEQRDFERSDAAIGRTRMLLGRDHPFIERLAIANRLAQGDPQGALVASRAALERFPDARALVRLHGEALVAANEPAEAVRFLEDRIAQYRGDGRLWRLLSEANGRLNRRAEAHRAAAEEFALAGAWQTAVEQLRMAQRAGDSDYFSGSMIDARLREFQAEARRELEEQRQPLFR